MGQYKKNHDSKKTKQFESINAIKTSNGLTIDCQQIADTFASHIANISSNQDNKEEEDTISFSPNSVDECDYNAPFTHNEFELVLKEVESSCPGLDGITIQMIRNRHTTAKITLFSLLNKVWETHSIPKSCKEVLIVPIHKQGREKLNPISYIPISITNHISKILERLVFKRLQWILENQNLLNKQQYGFRKNRSTQDYLNIFDTDIKYALATNENLYAI